MNFYITTKASNTQKQTYLAAIINSIASEIGTGVNKTFLGIVFVSGVDAFSCYGAVRGGVIRMSCISSNASTFSVIRQSDGSVSYKEFAPL